MKRILITLSALALLCSSCATTGVPAKKAADNDVVDLGYTKESRRNTATSTAHMEMTDKDNGTFHNMYEYLQGKVAGVNIQGDVNSGNCTIIIRGVQSLNFSSEPLILYDGQEVNDLMSINPNDVASVEVLKDPSSCAIYGSRGANGVILIRAKKPDR